MARPLKVLISAYACEPNKGSEPEAGWQWAMQMARHHDVSVLTRANNRGPIEAFIGSLPAGQPVPLFYFHDCKPVWLALKKRLRALNLYYVRWQQTAREIVGELHRGQSFDLIHHVTFAAYRYPSAIWGHGVASLWGPIGGVESIPAPLLPWKHPSPLFKETFRNIDNFLQTSPLSSFPRRALASTAVLATTREMQRALENLGLKAGLMPTIGLNPASLPFRPREPHTGPLRLLYVGNLLALKGLDLGLEALKLSGTGALLTLVGDGSFEPALRRVVQGLGLEGRVRFVGRLPREEVLRCYTEYDALLFPSLHDTGGYAVIEAMFNELPVICLDCGGPGVAVAPGTGQKVPLGNRAQVIAGLAEAIRTYDRDRELLRNQARQARSSVLEHYDWSRKAGEMNACYEETVRRFAGRRAS